MWQNIDNLKQIYRLKRFLVVVVLTSLIFIVGLLFFGCSNNPLLEDILPISYGEPEGLWLYKGDERSRTDGSEAEKILGSIIIDGKKYSNEQFSVSSLKYVVSDHTLFFVIDLEDKSSHLYLYNYSSKEGEVLFSTNVGETMIMAGSDTYVYIETSVYIEPGNWSTTNYLLYSLKGELLCDSVQGQLLDDVLFASDDGEESTFIWYKDGEIRQVTAPTDTAFGTSLKRRFGDFMYFLNEHVVYAVDLNTGEYRHLAVVDSSVHRRQYAEMCYANGEVYMLSTVNVVEIDGGTQTVTNPAYLHRFVGLSAELVHSFGELNGDPNMNLVGDTVQISVWRHGSGCSTAYYDIYNYDPNTREMKSTTSRNQPSRGISSPPLEKKIVNGYTFYVDYKSYWGDGFLGGSFHQCYFLYREDPDGLVEVMQYSINGPGHTFYDDICNF